MNDTSLEASQVFFPEILNNNETFYFLFIQMKFLCGVVLGECVVFLLGRSVVLVLVRCMVFLLGSCVVFVIGRSVVFVLGRSVVLVLGSIC